MKQTNRIDTSDRSLDNGQPSFERREYLQKVGSVAVLSSVGSAGVAQGQNDTTDKETVSFNEDPFTLGIASGDPLPTAVVIWTRLAPEPFESDGGMPNHQVPVQWRVATDEQMNNVVKRGTAHARPEYAHSVHCDVKGLEPNTEYYYQFEVSSNYSTSIGATKTAPTTGQNVDEFTLAFASCQHYPTGYYTAYQHMAEQDLDLVIHLGDYIYEGEGQGPETLDRGHEPPRETESLDDYRIRYAQYKTDSNLQAAHAAFPWIVTWDDHEVVNDYADDDHSSAPPEEFLQRRADAYQAFWEHLPLRAERMPDGPDLPLYRRFTFGELAEFNVLDTRQYRDEIIYGEDEEPTDGYYPSSLNSDRTILGDEQERWLLDGLDDSTAQWNVLAQQVIFAAMDTDPDPDTVSYMDQNKTDKWNGYKPNRDRLLDFMTEQPELNPIVLTGDIHENYVFNIKSDFADSNSETVGTEFVGTSISSFGDGSGGGHRSDQTVYEDEDEPYQKFFNDDRGYVHCTITPDQWKTDFHVVSTVEEPAAPVNTLASFITEAGNPGAKRITPSIQFEVPETYQPDPFNESLEPLKIIASVKNPEGDDAATATVENLTLSITEEPDDWTITASTSTEFDTISDGESVTADWEVVPGSINGDVTLLVEATYEINGTEYQYSDTAVLSAAKLADWRFENETTDSSSYDNSFSLKNGAEYDDQVAIEGEYSVFLDGTDDYILLSEGGGDGFLHEPFYERTVSMWIAPDSTAGRQGIYNEGGSADGLAVRIVDGTLEAGVAISGDNSDVTTVTSSFTHTDWVHLAVVYDNGALRLYVDGEEVASESAVTPELDDEFTDVNEHSANAVIGSSNSDVWEEGVEDSYFAGHIDATTVYSHALSTEQISTLSTMY